MQIGTFAVALTASPFGFAADTTPPVKPAATPTAETATPQPVKAETASPPRAEVNAALDKTKFEVIKEAAAKKINADNAVDRAKAETAKTIETIGDVVSGIAFVAKRSPVGVFVAGATGGPGLDDSSLTAKDYPGRLDDNYIGKRNKDGKVTGLDMDKSAPNAIPD